MKKLFFAAFATFTVVSISSVFANKAMMANVPEGLASDSDTTVTAPVPAEPVEAPAEPATSSEKPSTEVAEPLTSNTAGDGMYLMEPTDTAKTDTTVAAE